MEYVHVIVPLRLDWEPLYLVPEGMIVNQGDRVRVRVAGREYIGVVHNRAASTDINESRIQPVLENCSRLQEGGLACITGEELSLWEFVADYYMCTIGEVYKAAYPAARSKVETSKSRRGSAPQAQTPHRQRRDSDVKICRRIYDAFEEGRPVLLLSESRESKALSCAAGARETRRRTGEEARRIADILARRSLEEGRCVLIMTPEVGDDAPEGYLRYSSATTPVSRRDVADRTRSGKPCIVYGTRTSVFLPFTNLGLVIVLDEHSSSYKQTEPSPRYNGRDLAVKLATLHKANVLLCSEMPSLESLANCDNGKYILVRSCADVPDEGSVTASRLQGSVGHVTLIDTTAERHKNGMKGELSRKLIGRMSETLENKGSVALLVPWKNTADLEIEARSEFPQARRRLTVMSLSESRYKNLSKYDLTALIGADFLLKGQDFRTDEKALRILLTLARSSENSMIIQTADANHPIFSAVESDCALDTLKSMMPLRREFNLPPYSRIIDLVFKDGNDSRRFKMMRLLSSSLNISGQTDSTLRITLAKDRNLPAAKRTILKTVSDFLSAHNYKEFVHFDADPF